MDENKGQFLPRYEAICKAFDQLETDKFVQDRFHLLSYWYGFLSGAFIVAIINLIYKLVVR